LPRLEREWCRGLAFVHWTGGTENRAIGWLTGNFHAAWQLTLLHACSRYELACAAYTLMPDHFHLLWLGLNEHGSDQRVAIEFLLKYTRHSLGAANWQRQPYDHVLREDQRARDSFTDTAGYILDNPVRAGLVIHRHEWPHQGCCVPGYPKLDVHNAEYWPLFWRVYSRLIETRSTRSRSQPPA
jgi:putative transposase